MKALDASSRRTLSCLLLLTNIAFASREADVSMRYPVGIAGNSAVRLAATTVLANLTQESTTPAKENSAPKPEVQMPPDYEVGAVVGAMFLAGVILLFAKWPRRRASKNIYRFPRPPRKARRAS